MFDSATAALLLLGGLCIVAAIAGGGVKAFGVEIVILSSPKARQGIGIAGLIFLSLGVWLQVKADHMPVRDPAPQKEHDPTPAPVQAAAPVQQPIQPCSGKTSGTASPIICGNNNRVSNGANDK